MKRVLLTMFALGGAMYACQSPVENVEVGLKPSLATNIELRFKPQGGLSPQSVNVRIVGPDADKVVTVLNTKNFKVDDDGVLKLATLESVSPDSEHPLRFTVVAKADNYMEVVQPVTLLDNNQRTAPVTMFSNHTTSSIVQATGQSDAVGSLKKAVTMQTGAGTASAQATVTIPQGTLLKDAMDRPVDGDLVVRMHPLTVTSAMDLPNNGMLTNLNTATDGVVGTEQLSNIAGAVTLDIHNNDYQTVKTFSAPIRLAFAVNPQTVNPETNERIKHGDAIPMFSYDAATDRWQQETDGLIQTNSRTGLLECVAQLSHLSTWTAAHKKPTCKEGPSFKVLSNFKDYDMPFLCQVVYVDKNGKDLSVANSFYRELNNGSEIELSNLNRNQFVRLKVFENPADMSKFIASPTVKSCGNGKVTIDVRALKGPANPSATTFTVQFPCTVDGKKLPEEVTAQYRETGTSAWKNLITLERKDVKGDRLQGSTRKVTQGKRYDLRIKVLSFSFEQPNQLIDKKDWVIPYRGKNFCKK